MTWGSSGGRCWVRTNVGLADCFTVSRIRPIGIATDLLFLHFRRVNTAFCPCGVRSPALCLASATQVLDHVPSSPAESQLHLTVSTAVLDRPGMPPAARLPQPMSVLPRLDRTCDHPDPGAGEDAHGVRVVFAAGASVVIDLRGLLAGVTHADRRPELAPASSACRGSTQTKTLAAWARRRSAISRSACCWRRATSRDCSRNVFLV